MRKKALHKDVLKEFSKSITRFLSIMIMIALGSFIIVGLYVTGPTMRRTILTYTDTYHLEDMIVTTPFGLENEDKVLLSALTGVEILDYSYRTDLMLAGSDIVVRTESIGKLPSYEIVAGRLPEATNEIALDTWMQQKGYKIGDPVSFTPQKFKDSYVLNHFDYIIVGFINSPEYLMPTAKGTATIGDGTVDAFGLIETANFSLANVSLARLTFKDVQGLSTYSDQYKTLMQAHTDALDDVFAARPEIRLQRYQKEGIEEISTAEGEITDAEQQLIDAKIKLDDAKAKLDQGWADYQAGKVEFTQKIKDAEKKITAGQEELWTAKAKLDDGYAKYATGEQEMNQARADYNDAKATLDSAGVQIADGQKQLDAAQKTLDDNRAALEQQTAEVNAGLAAINAGLVQSGLDPADEAVDGQLAAITNQISQAELGLAAVNGQIAGFDPAVTVADLDLADLPGQIGSLAVQRETLVARQAELNTISTSRSLTPEEQAELDAIPAQITLIDLKTGLANLYIQQATLSTTIANLRTVQGLLTNKQTLLSSLPQLNAAKIQLDEGQKTLDAQWTEFNARKAEYEAGVSQLAAGGTKIANGLSELERAKAELADGQAQYDQGVIDLETARKTLASEKAKGEAELEKAYQKILDGEKEYEDGLQAYKEKLPGAEEDIAQGKTDIKQAKSQLARLKVPDYTIYDRYKDPGFFQYIENSESMDFLSYVFPVFFFLIALLVSLTTMTRMVDEQRLQIGTLKALSYTNWDIIWKYLSYGSLASLLGSMIGIVAGQKILMPVVFAAYSSNFLFTKELPELNPVFGILAIIISLLCTGFVALMTTSSSLKENVASLLRPKAPKTGNRILIERITPLWRRLSFHNKVTARNIFRYKKRMMMTILGVSGCAALIFMGFGIRDSIGSILGKQYGDLFRYSNIVVFDENAAAEDLQAFSDELANDSRIAKVYPARMEQGLIQIRGKLDQSINIVVPSDEKAFQEINLLRHRLTKKPIELKDGAVISEKIAMLLGIGAGDTLEFQDVDGALKKIKIVGVTENYTAHYMYLPVDYYEEIFAKTYHPNSDFLVLKDANPEATSQFSREMLDKDIVLSAVNTHATSDTIDKLTGSMNIIVLVILLASSMLAIVVLYNLTNINVSERIRELSTIMVLGFYPGEVTAYVYRETMALTTIGILVGYVFGRMLHYYVISSLAPTNVLLDPAVNLSTYILSAIFTLAFSLIVMLIMHRKLKRIDMVQALKAVE